MKIFPTKGTYFVLLDYSKISNKKDTDFAIELIEKFKIASIPMSVFYHQQKDYHLLRFCFAKKDETLENAGKIISVLKN
jgi:methionine aminotransferase